MKKINEVKEVERLLKQKGFKKVPKSKWNEPLYKETIDELRSISAKKKDHK
jgi:hypothetical protein